MNILAIDGSPRKEGTIATLLKIMCAELESAGCDVTDKGIRTEYRTVHRMHVMPLIEKVCARA